MTEDCPDCGLHLTALFAADVENTLAGRQTQQQCPRCRIFIEYPESYDNDLQPIWAKPAPWQVTPEMEEIFKKAGTPVIVTGDPHRPTPTADVVNKALGTPKRERVFVGNQVGSLGDQADSLHDVDWTYQILEVCPKCHSWITNLRPKDLILLKHRACFQQCPKCRAPIEYPEGYDSALCPIWTKPQKPNRPRTIARVPDIDVDKAIAEEQESRTVRGYFTLSGDVSDFSMLHDEDDDSEDEDDDPVTDEDIERAARIDLANPRQTPYSMSDITEEETPVSQNPYQVGDRLAYRPKNEVVYYTGTIDKVDGEMIFLKLDEPMRSGANRVGCQYDSAQLLSADAQDRYPDDADVVPKKVAHADVQERYADLNRLLDEGDKTPLPITVTTENGFLLVDQANGMVLRVEKRDNGIVIDNLNTPSARFHVPSDLVSALGKALGEL